MFNFVRVQVRQKFQPQEYIKYFEALKFETDAVIGQISSDFERGRFAKVSGRGLFMPSMP
ncbi:MAG: hypothetical protein SRB1_01419 [Desulfobacteraceae bacterium Eth-SRB1]|nr:MAG: hypothetical protein SRB1_01419 [Desulfobacteraceae bacterium Eth-SRB1]